MTDTSKAIELIEEMSNDKRAAGRFHSARINSTLKFKAECHYALGIVKGSKQLQKAIPETVQECIEDVARLGLTLSPSLAHAYLVPRYIKDRGMVCTLYTSWRGLTVAARTWGGLLDMTANVVYSNEPFEIFQGTAPTVNHQVIPEASKRGGIVGAYCIAYMKAEIIKVEYIDASQIERAKASSESPDGQYSPWKNWPEEMARKTVVRRAAKHWTGTPEMASSIAIQNKYEGIGERTDDDEPASFDLITSDQVMELHARLSDNDCNVDKVVQRICRVMEIENISDLGAHRLAEAREFVQKAITHRDRSA